MSTISETTKPRLRYHPNAYRFVDSALRYTQKKLGRVPDPDRGVNDESAHITGAELLEGIRELAQKQFGLMARTVFKMWGVRTTDDFGRIVFDFVERGIMRKTSRDRLSDFYDVYDFEEVFDRQYHIDTSQAFRR